MSISIDSSGHDLRAVLHGVMVWLSLCGSLLLSGCGLLYENSRSGPAYTLHSNHDAVFVKNTGRLIELIYREYLELFSLQSRELGTTTFLLDGEAGIVDMGYSPELLGYYVPFFRMIHIDTTPSWTREPAMLQQILLHEIAHHFLITRDARTNDHYWLNEGLAGNLEITLFDEEHFEYVLLNPTLLRIARKAVDEDRVPLARDLLEMTWREFHDSSTKEVNYALSWSLVHYLLTDHFPGEAPLKERLDLLLALETSEVESFQERWIQWLRTCDLTDRLVTLASGDTAPGVLTRCWAIEQLSSVVGLDLDKSVNTLISGFNDDDPAVREKAGLALLRISSHLAADVSDRPVFASLAMAREQISNLIATPGEAVALRGSLIREASRNLRSEPLWVQRFIDLLDDPAGELRALAARGLAEADMKPTYLNPEFWKSPANVTRDEEIREWQEWWRKHGPTRPAPWP